MRISSLFATACAALLISCAGGRITGSVPQGSPPRFTINVWVQDDVRLHRAAVMEGCALWAPLGIGCEETRDPAQAHARFEARTVPCPPSSEGRKGTNTIALAHSDGLVEMFVNCYAGDGGKIDTHKMRMVAAHEIGHLLGIWKHVPLECGAAGVTYRTLPDGRPLCGEAVMNPEYDDDCDALTHVDGNAFSLRDRANSIYRPASGDGPPPSVICTYDE